MRRFRNPDNTSSCAGGATPGWIDSLPSGGQVHISPNVPTAAQLLAAAEVSQAA